MEIGYARTSTLEQKAGLGAQLRDLKAAGVKTPLDLVQSRLLRSNRGRDRGALLKVGSYLFRGRANRITLANQNGRASRQRPYIAAWKCERVGNVGKNRPKREHSQGEHQLRGTAFAGEPHHREKPKIMGHDDFNRLQR